MALAVIVLEIVTLPYSSKYSVLDSWKVAVSSLNVTCTKPPSSSVASSSVQVYLTVSSV